MSESELFGGETPVAKPKAPGLGEQLMGVFTNPVELFQKLYVAPSWGWALGAILLAGLLMSVVWGFKVDVDLMMRPGLEQNPQVSAAQIDQTISLISRFMPIIMPVAFFFITPVALLFMALLYWLVGMSTAEGEKPSFLQAFSAVSVSGLTSVPYMLLITVMCLIRNVGGLAPEKLSPTSVAYYFHPESPKLMGLMTQLDIFVLAGFVMVYLSSRHAMRLKPLGAGLCTAIAVLFSVVFKILLAK